MHRGQRKSVHRMHPTSYAVVVMVRYTKRIKFMINAFKGKIDTHKAVVMILNDKADHLINAFGITFLQLLLGII